jgi:hypothetical protein
MFQWSLDDSWILIASKKEILESETAISLTAGSFLGVSSPHAVLSRPGEGGPQVLGLDECQETVRTSVAAVLPSQQMSPR